MPEDNGQKVRIEHLEASVEEIKEIARADRKDSQKARSDFRVLLAATREDFAGLKTEVRIVGGIFLTMLTVLIGVVLSHTLTP